MVNLKKSVIVFIISFSDVKFRLYYFLGYTQYWVFYEEQVWLDIVLKNEKKAIHFTILTKLPLSSLNNKTKA